MISHMQLEDKKVSALFKAKEVLLALDQEVVNLQKTYIQKVLEIQQQISHAPTLSEQETIQKTLQQLENDFENEVFSIKARIRKAQNI